MVPIEQRRFEIDHNLSGISNILIPVIVVAFTSRGTHEAHLNCRTSDF